MKAEVKKCWLRSLFIELNMHVHQVFEPLIFPALIGKLLAYALEKKRKLREHNDGMMFILRNVHFATCFDCVSFPGCTDLSVDCSLELFRTDMNALEQVFSLPVVPLTAHNTSAF